MSSTLPLSPTQASAPLWPDAARERAFQQWLDELDAQQPTLHLQRATLRTASADASFRRYFRIDGAAASYIIMDAPPAVESSQDFVRIAGLFTQARLHVPQILDWNEAQGFLLLTDLGQYTLLQAQQAAGLHRTMAAASATEFAPFAPYYHEAIRQLVHMQRASQQDPQGLTALPPYDHALLHRELQLFDTWYIGKHLGYTLSADEAAQLQSLYASIIARNLTAPTVWVHRDFMPRNLMLPAAGQTRLGILDFQDAVCGPISYDIASLMRDAFHTWDEEVVLDITVRYWECARAAGLMQFADWQQDFAAFYQAVDWMALQRHLKVAGIFARLTHRDGKAHYVQDAPRFLAYIRHTAGRYRELTPLLRLLDKIENVATTSMSTFGPLR